MKLDSASGSPLPLYFAYCGYLQSGRCMAFLPGAAKLLVATIFLRRLHALFDPFLAQLRALEPRLGTHEYLCAVVSRPRKSRLVMRCSWQSIWDLRTTSCCARLWASPEAAATGEFLLSVDCNQPLSVRPPSTMISEPTVHRDSSEARYSTALATSSGVPKRPNGLVAAMSLLTCVR